MMEYSDSLVITKEFNNQNLIIIDPAILLTKKEFGEFKRDLKGNLFNGSHVADYWFDNDHVIATYIDWLNDCTLTGYGAEVPEGMTEEDYKAEELSWDIGDDNPLIGKVKVESGVVMIADFNHINNVFGYKLEELKENEDYILVKNWSGMAQIGIGYCDMGRYDESSFPVIEVEGKTINDISFEVDNF